MLEGLHFTQITHSSQRFTIARVIFMQLFKNLILCFSERLKREEQCRLEQEKWKRKMENEAVDAQDQLSDLGMLLADLRGSLAQKEKEITTLQGR